MKTLIAVLLMLASTIAATGEIDAKVDAALSADGRPEADVFRDPDRKPLETLKFFGLEDDMRVLELLPGGGWYTRVLAPVLADNGQLYVALGTDTVNRTIAPLPGFEKIEIIDTNENMRRPDGARLYVLDDFDFGVRDLDMVLTFRNVHNFGEAGRLLMHRESFEALRSGGAYGIVDHTRRHMEPDNNENRRRMDPLLVIREVQAAGFEFVNYSDIHFRADDELEYEVGRRSVSGNTDRFTLLFRKP
ncbi:MAG: methyltransferase [Proteobacteria bacterium]|nr:methyltransferase [Pseudomonadota bacterium]MDA1064079.1 methyltransferase [Pseudomonadota bacterium]